MLICRVFIFIHLANNDLMNIYDRCKHYGYKQNMKILKISAIVFAIGLLLQIYAYYNLKVSYNYEVDLMETNIKVDDNISNQERIKRTEHLKLRKKEILYQQMTTKIYLFIFLIGLIILLYIIFSRGNKLNRSIGSPLS